MLPEERLHLRNCWSLARCGLKLHTAVCGVCAAVCSPLDALLAFTACRSHWLIFYGISTTGIQLYILHLGKIMRCYHFKPYKTMMGHLKAGSSWMCKFASIYIETIQIYVKIEHFHSIRLLQKFPTELAEFCINSIQSERAWFMGFLKTKIDNKCLQQWRLH